MPASGFIALKLGAYAFLIALLVLSRRLRKQSYSGMQIHVFVTGKVQGVYYRDSTIRKAEKLGLSGWVRNLPDDRVEYKAAVRFDTPSAEAGAKKTLEDFIKWSWKGPEGAKEVGLDNDLTAKRHVDDVQVTWSDSVDKDVPKGSFEKKKTPAK